MGPTALHGALVFLGLSSVTFAEKASMATHCKPGEAGCKQKKTSGTKLLHREMQISRAAHMFEEIDDNTTSEPTPEPTPEPIPSLIGRSSTKTGQQVIGDPDAEALFAETRKRKFMKGSTRARPRPRPRPPGGCHSRRRCGGGGAGGNCLTSAAVLRTPNGMKAITTLSATDPLDVFEVASIGEDETISSQDLLGVFKGKVVGWAAYDPNTTLEVLQFTYGSSAGILQVTKGHFLMVKGEDDGVVLKQSQHIGVGDYLAAMVAEGQKGVSWRRILSSQLVTTKGLYMPLVMSDAGPGDVLVLADGILVPMYSQYGGLTPSQAHLVFEVWEKHWQDLLSQHPCLDQVPRHHAASIAVEIVRDFSKKHPGKLLQEELHPNLLICLEASKATIQKFCPQVVNSTFANCDHT